MARRLVPERPHIVVWVASAEDVAERWHNQHHIGGLWRKIASGDTGAVYDKLVALGSDPAVADADKVIGNKSWTHICCDGCFEYTTIAAAIGEYEAKTYCLKCLRAGVKLIEQAERDGGLS